MHTTKSYTLHTPEPVWSALDDLKNGDSYNDYIVDVLSVHVLQEHDDLTQREQRRIRRIVTAEEGSDV